MASSRTLVAVFLLVQTTWAFRFSFLPPFTDTSDILVGGNATKTSQSLVLGFNQTFQAARAIYSRPIRLVNSDTGSAASFSTSFTFQIQQFTFPGADGMAFFLTSASQSQDPPHDSYGLSLGLVSPGAEGNSSNQIVAVEFDTFWNYFESSDHHVAIDVNGVKEPLAAANLTGGLNFTSNAILVSWIDYDSTEGVMEVRVAENGSSRPAKPLVSARLRLSDYLKDHVYVGFSGATGSLVELHQVLSWEFKAGGFRVPALAPVPAYAPGSAYTPEPEYAPPPQPTDNVPAPALAPESAYTPEPESAPPPPPPTDNAPVPAPGEDILPPPQPTDNVPAPALAPESAYTPEPEYAPPPPPPTDNAPVPAPGEDILPPPPPTMDNQTDGEGNGPPVAAQSIATTLHSWPCLLFMLVLSMNMP